MEALGMTINQHIMETQRERPEVATDLCSLFNDLLAAAKIISREVNKAGLVGILGLTGEINVQGEEVQKLDEYANETITRQMAKSGNVCVMASEEITEPIPVKEGYEGKYTLAFDPLDGSSNIDVNVNIGTIFSVHQKITPGETGTIDDLLQPGNTQICAGYIVYGSSTMLVYAAGRGVNGFTLDPSIGEFILSHPDIKIPAKGKIYSVNEGNHNYWHENTKRYVDYLKEKDPDTKRPYSLRYIGSLVADFHRTLLKGGIFMYPMDYKDPNKPKGKLRLLYEAAPMAYIVEQAGGRASDGEQNILDINPTGLHQRVPLYIGSREDVELAEKFVQGKA
jgi:fructose-1,6-bisphosphatase I